MRLVWPIVEALRQVDGWPCEHVAVCVTGAGRGDARRRAPRFEWASVTKLASAVAMLVAAEEGLVDLDEPAGPPGATFRHLLSHSSGLPFEAGAPISEPGRRRIYSNYGFEVAAALVAERAEMPFETYFAHVWQGTTLRAARARPAPARPGRSPTCGRSRTSCSGRRGSRMRRSQRRRRCSSRGSSASCPGSAGRSRTTGGSGSSCATASRRTGRAPATAPRDVRPLRPQRHVPLGRPRRRARARRAHRPRRSATGRRTRGRASPTRCWPKRACPGDSPRDTA